MGSKSTGGDLNRHQAQAVLIDKDFAATPLSEVEKTLKLFNMKEWQCCIVQISFQNADPIIDPIAYALLFNNLSNVSNWVCSGEFNEHKIFHVHCMLQTNSRSDSAKRTMENEWQKLSKAATFISMFGTDCTSDCLKIQRCHKPESMMGYLMKDPTWVMSNSDRVLQTMYDIDAWQLNARFKTKPEVAEPEMQEITKTLIDIIIAGGCKTVADIMRQSPEAVAKYLHKPGLGQIMGNCLTYVEATGGAWELALFDKYDPNPEAIHKCLLHQGISPVEFDEIFHKWITKQHPKKNTIVLQGPSNTGKSSFIAGLKACVPWGEIVNGNNFQFEGLAGNVIGCWEEPLCSPEAAEKTKQIFEGMTCSIPIKYKKPHMLPRTPIIVTTNHNIWRFCTAEEDAFRNRMHIFFFEQPVQNTNYTPRISEHRCKCRYCTASSRCSPSHGESEPCGVQRANEPLPTGEQWSIRTEHSAADVCSGSMRDPGEGTSRSYYSSPGCSSTRAEECSSDTTGHPSSSSSSAVELLGYQRYRSSHTGDRMGHTEPESGEYVEPYNPRRDPSSDSGATGEYSARQQFLKRHYGATGYYPLQRNMLTELGSMGPPSKKAKEISVLTKQQRVDRVLSAKMTHPIKLPMYVPQKGDWAEYLSWLYHIYG